MRQKVVILTTIVILILVNSYIFTKESHLKNGAIVYLELAPVDPRSLMQGDYMALRFAIADDIRNALRKTEDKNWDNTEGFAILKVDDKKRGTFSSLSESSQRGKDEISLFYRVRKGQVKIATNAFFFEEGQGEKYEAAGYGKFRVNEDGDPLLVDLYDKEVQEIK